jgi:hypothetical protein
MLTDEFVMGMALWGTVLGAIFGGIPTNKMEEKNPIYGLEFLFWFQPLVQLAK